ncbi:MAG: hypothetical protein ACRDSH_06245, partial [Pseudonocardiaceae bacterium]
MEFVVLDRHRQRLRLKRRASSRRGTARDSRPNWDASGYVAWFEWFAPQQAGSPPYIFQTNISNFNVQPGQPMYCVIQYINGAGNAFLSNSADSPFSITLA